MKSKRLLGMEILGGGGGEEWRNGAAQPRRGGRRADGFHLNVRVVSAFSYSRFVVGVLIEGGGGEEGGFGGNLNPRDCWVKSNLFVAPEGSVRS